MSPLLQNAIALALVAAALGYLAWNIWRTVARKMSGCGGCRACPAAKPTAETTAEGKPFVAREALLVRKD